MNKKEQTFEIIYSFYPRKMGKSAGYKKYQKNIKTLQDQNDLLVAIHRFVDYHKKRKTDPEFIPYFSTFMTNWKDWLCPDTGEVTLSSQATTQKTKEQSSHYRSQAELILAGEI